MRPVKVVLALACWVIVVLVVSIVVVATELWGPASVPAADKDLPVLGTVPAFQFLDQDGNPVTHASLRGSPWIADFIFTRCAGPCPIMTAKMSALEAALPSQVKFISFSCDPEYDTPSVLKKYARRFSADELRWKFLTGDKDVMMAQARGMLMTAIPAYGDQPIIHDERFLLIDGQERIRGAYESMDPGAISNLEHDAKGLVVSHK